MSQVLEAFEHFTFMHIKIFWRQIPLFPSSLVFKACHGNGAKKGFFCCGPSFDLLSLQPPSHFLSGLFLGAEVSPCLGCYSAVSYVHSPGDFDLGIFSIFQPCFLPPKGLRGDNMLLTSPFPVPWLKYSYWCIFVTKNEQFCSISRKSPFPPPSSQVLVLAHSMLETEQKLMVKLQHLGRIGFRCMLSETILHCQVGGRDNLICDPSNVRDHIM